MYIVNLSKPPIGPPSITMRQGWFSFYETKESKQRTIDYNIYIEEYMEQLRSNI